MVSMTKLKVLTGIFAAVLFSFGGFFQPEERLRL
jgi:hypothetical protein